MYIKQPPGTSQVRPNGFTEGRMDEFYKNPEKISQITPSLLDAYLTLMRVVFLYSREKYQKLTTRKQKEHIAATISTARGSLITIVICMRPAGIHVSHINTISVLKSL